MSEWPWSMDQADHSSNPGEARMQHVVHVCVTENTVCKMSTSASSANQDLLIHISHAYLAPAFAPCTHNGMLMITTH